MSRGRGFPSSPEDEVDMSEDLERRIDELYAGPLDAFTAGRDAIARELRGEGDADGAKRVKALRKPVVPAWALNRLAREDPRGVEDLVGLGERLRSAQRRAISGGDPGAFRDALDERRRLVGRLAQEASAILERDGARADAHEADLTATLEAATVDEEAGRLLVAGRLTKPLRPPATLGDPGLRTIEGGRASGPAVAEADETRSRAERRAETQRLAREVAAAERRERRATEAVERARRRLEDADRRRADAREAVRAAEAERRGAALEHRRLAARLGRAR
jgi:hypothetical protein